MPRYLQISPVIRYCITRLNELIKLQGGVVKIPKPEKVVLPAILEEAIQSKKTIIIEYLTAEGFVSKRQVSNIEVSKYKDSIYLIGMCKLRNEQRTFRLDRVVKMDLE